MENHVIVGADVSNDFGEAPPTKQGFYICPDRDFREWWLTHLKRSSLWPDAFIPVKRAIQGHLESPRLWEKHIDKILCDYGL